jgi:hypothetical protein
VQTREHTCQRRRGSRLSSQSCLVNRDHKSDTARYPFPALSAAAVRGTIHLCGILIHNYCCLEPLHVAIKHYTTCMPLSIQTNNLPNYNETQWSKLWHHPSQSFHPSRLARRRQHKAEATNRAPHEDFRRAEPRRT